MTSPSASSSLKQKPSKYTIDEDDEQTRLYFFVNPHERHSHHCLMHEDATVVIDYDKSDRIIGVEVLIPKR
jgi:hypothetical protein